MAWTGSILQPSSQGSYSFDFVVSDYLPRHQKIKTIISSFGKSMNLKFISKYKRIFMTTFEFVNGLRITIESRFNDLTIFLFCMAECKLHMATCILELKLKISSIYLLLCCWSRTLFDRGSTVQYIGVSVHEEWNIDMRSGFLTNWLVRRRKFSWFHNLNV